MSLECYEEVDAKAIEVILNHQDYFKSLMRPESFEGEYGFKFTQLRKYYNALNSIGQVKVIYKQKDGEGRMFAEGGLSLQMFPREIRATISKDLYYDIDIVNAHPVLLQHICKIKFDFIPEYLIEYINKREKVINEILELNPEQTHESVKHCILSIINGGTNLYKSFLPSKWMKKFKHEIAIIHEKCKKTFPAELEKVKRKNKSNIDGSLINHVLCVWENNVLNSMIEYLNHNHIIKDNFVCCFDGLMIPKDDDEMVNLDKIMTNLEKHIFNKYDIELKLKNKEMVGFDILNIPDTVKYFKTVDTYYWMDFMNDLKSKTWDNLDLLKEFSRFNINRVMLVLATNEIYIKKDNDEPFQFIKELPEYIIKYKKPLLLKNKAIDEIVELPFKRLFKKELINYVKMYNNLTLKPLPPMDDVQEQNEKSRDFNVWNGFKAKLIPRDNIDVKLIEKLLNHIKVVWANNNDEIFKYICSWFHAIFKYPFKKSKVAMVFQSDEQQIGKSIIIEEFLIPFVFGKKLSIVEEGIGFATERFNNRMMGKLFVCCEELNNIADTGNYHTTFDTMKKLLTNKTMQVEWKNGAKIEIDSFMNFILFTNNQFSIKVEKSDARYFITQCDPVYQKNFKYFNELVATFNQETADHFFSYIYHMDDAIDVRDIPDTKLKQEIKLNCLPSPQRFLFRVKELRESKEDDDYIGWKNRVIEENELTALQLFGYYKSYCQEENEREFSQTKFGRCIGSMIQKVKSNVVKYDMNSIS